jgi:hypothetical protein
VATVPAIRTSTGTFPEGSQWTRNPFPMNDEGVGALIPGLPDVFGRGPFPYSVMDEVRFYLQFYCYFIV